MRCHDWIRDPAREPHGIMQCRRRLRGCQTRWSHHAHFSRKGSRQSAQAQQQDINGRREERARQRRGRACHVSAPAHDDGDAAWRTRYHHVMDAPRTRVGTARTRRLLVVAVGGNLDECCTRHAAAAASGMSTRRRLPPYVRSTTSFSTSTMSTFFVVANVVLEIERRRMRL